MSEQPKASSHLAFALRWLAPDRRDEALAFYRFCREIDDIADNPVLPAEEKRVSLDAWWGRVRDGLPPDLERLVALRGVPRELFLEIIEGCASDIEPQRFETFAHLEAYCWRVACAVGLVSIRIFGCHAPESEEYAVNLGHALQITNILRDVGEDARMGRIYLPLEDLARFGVAEADLLAGRPGAGFSKLMELQAERARRRFAAAIPPASDRKALLAPAIMKALYARILERLARRGFPVFEPPLRLSTSERVWVALGVVFRERVLR